MSYQNIPGKNTFVTTVLLVLSTFNLLWDFFSRYFLDTCGSLWHSGGVCVDIYYLAKGGTIFGAKNLFEHQKKHIHIIKVYTKNRFGMNGKFFVMIEGGRFSTLINTIDFTKKVEMRELAQVSIEPPLRHTYYGCVAVRLQRWAQLFLEIMVIFYVPPRVIKLFIFCYQC